MADDDRSAIENLQMPLTWVGIDELPVSFVNQFIAQLDNDMRGAFLTVGVTTPPVVLGTIEERIEQVQRLPFVPVQAVARFGLTRERLEELRGLLNSVAETWPKGPEGEGEESEQDG